MRLLTSLLLLAAVPVFAAEYPLDLSRPMAEGDSYHLTATASDTTTMVLSQAATEISRQQQKADFSISADVTVLEANAKGMPTKLRILIGELKVRVGSDGRDMLSPGAVVIATQEKGRSHYTVEGSAVDGPTRECLSHFVNPSVVTSPTEQEMFGPKGPVKVGDSWEVNPVAFARLMADRDIRFKPGEVKGNFRLVESLKLAQRDVLRVDGNLKVPRIDLPVPEGATLSDASMSIQISELHPADGSSGQLQEKSTTLFEFATISENRGDGPPVTVRVKADLKTEKNFTY